jgi:NAD(P)-dependent dehydrogenase (short-subunit alcohol dehydrogenase family)
MFDLTGKVALVTGAGRNVGLGIARLLARRGAAVAVNDLVAERAKSGADRVSAEGGRAIASAFDVVDFDAASAAIRAVEEDLGPIDILVNNAGVPPEMDVAKFQDLDRNQWKKYVDLNLYAPLNMTKLVLDGMVERGFGRIITISSAAGQTGIAFGVSLYGAAKSGGIGFTRHLALEVAATGVTVNSIALGLMGTEEENDMMRQLASTIPVKRIGSPEDAGAAVVYLASEEAAWVTGQTLGVNGGSYTP